MAQDSDIARVWRQCNPTMPLEAGDQRYVPCDNVRGEIDLVWQLTNELRFSDAPMHLLFAGHRGAGKSTELKRLAKRLEEPKDGSDPFFVVYFEADNEDVDVNDVDFPDVLLAIVHQVGKALRERIKVDHERKQLRRIWDALGDVRKLFGTDVEFDKVDVDVKFAKLSGTIKSSPDARAEIRKALEPRVSNLIEVANEFLLEVEISLQSKGYRNLLVVVDNLDRIVLRKEKDSQYNSHEQLFINRGGQLNALRCYAIYTLPVSMVFTPAVRALSNIFGSDPKTLPMVKVTNQDGSDSALGLQTLQDMVQRRLSLAAVDKNIFENSETLDYLCRMSGGHFRPLLTMMRSACAIAGSLPLTQTTAEQVVHSIRNDFERALNKPEFFETLRKVDATHSLPNDECDSILLNNLSILEYINGDNWYGVNPVVKLIEKFKNAVMS